MFQNVFGYDAKDLSRKPNPDDFKVEQPIFEIRVAE